MTDESDTGTSTAAGVSPTGASPPESRRRLPKMIPRVPRDSDVEDRLGERLSQQLAHQWALMRAERRAEQEPAPVAGGPSNFSRAQVPWGLDLAAAWSWRIVVISAAAYVLIWLLARFALITVPLAISLLIAALASPAVRGLRRIGLPQGLAAGLVVLGTFATVVGLVTFVGQQVVEGSSRLADQVVKGLVEIRTWLQEGPLNASESQINGYFEQMEKAISAGPGSNGVVGQLGVVGTAVSHVLAGFFIILFATFFFLADGNRIWAFFVRLAPRAARERIDSSGRVAWVSLTQFVRATVLVALVDAVGIMIWAAVLGVPFVLAIGVLVFLGAFVPMVGATVAGAVAVLVALVDQGPVTALLMLLGVIVVQQVEGNVLQPFLLGRFVSLHPLGVIVALGCGILVAGIPGALIAVPLVAAGNAVVQHLASNTELRDDPAQDLVEELQAGCGTPIHDADAKVSDDA